MNDLLDTHDENEEKLPQDVEELRCFENAQFFYQAYQVNHSYHASVARDKIFLFVHEGEKLHIGSVVGCY